MKYIKNKCFNIQLALFLVNWARKWKGIASNKDVEKQPLPVESTGK